MNLVKFCSALLCFIAASVQAQIVIGGVANSNGPFTINDNVTMQFSGPVATMFTNTTGKTLATPTVGSGTFILLYNGQSIGNNTLPSSVTPTNTTKVLQVNPYDQNVYQAAGSLLGTDGSGVSSYLIYLADKLVTDGKFTQVILVPIGAGGSSVFDWASGVINQRARVACLLVRAKGWIGSGAKFGIIFEQGQADANAGTSSATWQSLFKLWRTTPAAMGCDFDTFVPIDTLNANAVSSTIQAAQAAVVDNVKVFAGANTDSLTGGTNRYDGEHLTNVGGQSNANLWATIIEAHY